MLVAGLVSGCSNGDDSPQSPVGTTARLDASQAQALEQRILDQRTEAIRTRNLKLFLAHVDPADQAFLHRQKRYFRNLVQLPLQTLRYRVRTAQWQDQRMLNRWGPDARIPQVELDLQLQGYDAVPVRRTVGFVFSFRHGRARIVSDRSATGGPLFLGTPGPWDLTAIQVRQEPGVLGIFDPSTVASSATVLGAVRDGITKLDRVLPFTWSDRIVVYSVQSRQVLRSFTDVPGGSIEHLGAMTFPTYAGDVGPSEVASTRMLVMPSSVRAGQPFLGRITRHELSHAAIGVRDDGSPTWVSEGIAEYLGARDLPQNQRIIPTEALARAKSADEGMPVSKDFNDSDQAWHYALSWMAFDYICTTYGEPRMWELMDAMHNGGSGTSDADQDRVLEQVLGYDARELARRAAARIRNIYG